MTIPLDLYGEVITASGTRYKWNSNETAGARPRNLSFSTKIGEGFSAGQLSLSRRIDLDYPDLSLVDTVRFVGGDGSVAWEGRVSALPRALDDAHNIGVTLTGWMAHAKDRKFQEIYVDRDLNSWTGMTARRRAAVLSTNGAFTADPNQTASPVDNSASIELGFSGAWTSPYMPFSEMYYYAGGIPIGMVKGSFTATASISAVDPNWSWILYLSTDDIYTSSINTTQLRAPSGSPSLSAGGRQDFLWAAVSMSYNATPGGADGASYMTRWQKMAVYGAHGLSVWTGEAGQPEGVLASDAIRNIASRWCPQLNTAGVEDTSYVIQHLVFKDRVYPYDAFLEINKYHLFQLAVWEDKTLHFKPYDMRSYDWEIRTDEPGTTFSPQGPGIDNVFNGIVVTYTDALKGTKNVLEPDDFPYDLMSTDPLNPWNMHGVNHWDEIELSTPTTQAQALQLGRAALADRNSPKTPGSITVQRYIRDRAGNKQPVWKVRAGDTIAVTNFPNDRPRLIVETDYDDERKQLSMSIDRPFATLDAYIDRTQTALTARGL